MSWPDEWWVALAIRGVDGSRRKVGRIQSLIDRPVSPFVSSISMPQRTANLGLGLRVLLGIIGTAAFGSGIIVAATELRSVYLGSPLVPTLFASLVAGLAAFGGGLLLRGAVRGRIAVRDPRGHK